MEKRVTAESQAPSAAPPADPATPNSALYLLFAKAGGGQLQVGAALAGLLVVTALVFARSIGNEFVLDDHDQIVGNGQLGNWSFIWESLLRSSAWFIHPLPLLAATYYRPLQNIWFAMNFHLFGLYPAGWHAAMIALHLLVVWMVFRVAALLCTDDWAALGAAGIFALMPIHAEAVAWPAAIAAPLSAVFELGAFGFYLLSRVVPKKTVHLAISMGLFGGALLSYDSAAAFPGLIAAYAFIFGLGTPGGGNSEERFGVRLRAGVRDVIIAVWPYAVEFVAYLVLRYCVLGFIATRPDPTNRVTALETLLTLPAAFVAYLILVAAPWLAGPAHRLPIAYGLLTPQFMLPLAGIAALAYVGIKALARHPHRRLYLFCAAWFLITLSPMMNLPGLFNESLLHDRYLYLPSVGFCVMAADLAAAYARRGEREKLAVWAVAGAVGIAYATMLFIAQGYWHDDIAALKRAIQAEPEEGTWRFRLGL
ncbi:MAG TPA: hypothetical protein VMT58_09450, partial [Candidatus Binataceae bacterium]|nr:hypothetical protein [Candidatus Binataceae bacterium]